MTLSIEKCEFAESEVKFVIHFVGSEGRRPDPDRLKGLEKMSRPQTKKELRKLLGAFGYYPDYVEHFAHIVKPLTDLTSKKVPNQLPWEECHQRAYELLLRFAHVLRIPKIGEPFVLHTDASGVAVGATLGQLDQGGVEHFASHKLSGPQCAWSTIERAAYANDNFLQDEGEECQDPCLNLTLFEWLCISALGLSDRCLIITHPRCESRPGRRVGQ